MDIYILVFLFAISFVLFILSRLLDGWKRVGFGWIAGGLIIITGMNIWQSGEVTIMESFQDKTYLMIPLNIGISIENFMLVSILVGLVMIFSSSGDWI